MAGIEYQDENGVKQIAQTLTFTGRVEQINDYITSSTSGSGGSSTTIYNKGTLSTTTTPVQISTTHTRNLDLFLISQNGKEINVKFKGWDSLAIRQGHIITLVWLKNNNNHSAYFAIVNKSLDKYWTKFGNLENFLRKQHFIDKVKRGVFRKIKICFVISYFLGVFLVFNFLESLEWQTKAGISTLRIIMLSFGYAFLIAICVTFIFRALIFLYAYRFGLKNWLKMLDNVNKQLENYLKSSF